MTKAFVRDPAICKRNPCASRQSWSYCSRCILDLKALMLPGMRPRAIEAHFEAIGRQRALTEAESLLLEYAIDCITKLDRDAAFRSRRKAA